MELIQYNNDFFYTYQRQGNDKYGNPIYLVNVFKKYYPCKNTMEFVYANYNFTYATNTGRKLTKHNEIRLQSYNIKSDVENIIKRL